MTMDKRIAKARRELIAQVDLHAVRFIDAYVRLIHAASCGNRHPVDAGDGHMEWEYCGTNHWYCAEMPPTDGQ